MSDQSSHRVERINELILREMVILLKQKTKDPRLQKVIITDIISSRDLSSAKVFFTVEESEKSIVEPLLEKASGFFRSSLSKKLKLRHTPALRFIFDPAPNTGARIEDLLSKI
jgi:ribosome-binding factor A